MNRTHGNIRRNLGHRAAAGANVASRSPSADLTDLVLALILLTVTMSVVAIMAGCSAEPQARGLPVATLLSSPAEAGRRGKADHSHADHSHADHSHADHSHAAEITPPARHMAGSHPVAPAAILRQDSALPLAVDLVISEVMSDPLVVADVVGEYVELVYLGAEPASLAGVDLVLPDGRALRLLPQAVAAPSSGAVAGTRAAGEVLSGEPGADRPARRKGRSRRRPLPPVRVTGVAADGVVRPGQVVVVWSTRAVRLRLANRAGRIELRRGGDVLDVAQWAGRWPWPKHRPGRALCRVAATRAGGLARSWRRCRTPLRQVERGSPGVVTASCDWLRRRNVRTASCAAALSMTRRRRLRRRVRRRSGRPLGCGH